MDTERVWRAIAAERSGLADMLERLAPADWEQPSLCPGWRVRDVAAHVTLGPRTSVWTAAAELVKARGNVSRMIYSTARREGGQPVDGLVGHLRAVAGSRRLPPGVHPLTTLLDVMVHAQDVAIPLGLTHPVPAEAAVAAADHAWALGWPFHARRRLRGFRVVATDVAWSRGSGVTVQGPIDAILLLLTGRPAALPRLGGDGATALRERAGVA